MALVNKASRNTEFEKLALVRSADLRTAPVQGGARKVLIGEVSADEIAGRRIVGVQKSPGGAQGVFGGGLCKQGPSDAAEGDDVAFKSRPRGQTRKVRRLIVGDAQRRAINQRNMGGDTLDRHGILPMLRQFGAQAITKQHVRRDCYPAGPLATALGAARSKQAVPAYDGRPAGPGTLAEAFYLTCRGDREEY